MGKGNANVSPKDNHTRYIGVWFRHCAILIHWPEKARELEGKPLGIPLDSLYLFDETRTVTRFRVTVP